VESECNHPLTEQLLIELVAVVVEELPQAT
jgi:hypothetical protein